MKILKLKSKNINSLKGEFSIDFTSFLDDNSLFAITGPTGAGKSTILDIITCALYGRTPRLKNPNELMARHTGECFCEVEFEIRGDIYRSSWTQKRARKSAEGKFQTAKMELSDVQNAKVLKSTLRDVPKYVEELSGLDFDRFIQSMMLAQGSFDAFLKAKEADRSTLLEKITGTQIYAKISKEIYDSYVTMKADIDSDKKVLDNTELLELDQIEEKTKNLDEYKKEKELLDKKEKELIQIKTWIETLKVLENDTVKYEELFSAISKEKEENKEDFINLDLLNKALNVQSIYDKKNTLDLQIKQNDKSLSEVVFELKSLKEQQISQQNHFEIAQQETQRVKKEFDENSIKIKEVRTFQTQINEKEKNLIDLMSNIQIKTEEQLKYQKNIDDIMLDYEKIEKQIETSKEYLKINTKDEKLLVSLSSIQKDIQDYENENKILSNILEEKEQYSSELLTIKIAHDLDSDEVKKIKTLFDLKTQEYEKVEKNSLTDTSDEPKFREKLNTLISLLDNFNEYNKLGEKIKNEERNKLSNTQELTYLTQSIVSKNIILNELKTHINTLREKRENELLIVKYEDDRQKIDEGDECFLCGSTSHPYISNDLKIDTDSTNILIKEKVTLLASYESEIKVLDTKQIQINSKLETNDLELRKLNELCESKKVTFQKESLVLDDDTQVNLEEQISLTQIQLEEIVQRREEKEKLLKEKEKYQESYNAKQTLFLQSQQTLDKIITTQEQNRKEESQVSLKLSELQSQLTKQFKIFDVTFEHLTYKDMLEKLMERNQYFISHKSNLKECEQKKNSYDLMNTENITKLKALSNDLVNYEESRVEIESSILSLKEESIEILNVADINMYELQNKNSFEKVQKRENNLNQELVTIVTKIDSLQKQQKLLEEEIIKNKTLFKETSVSFESELKNNSFEDVNSFENALLLKEQREDLTQKCKNIEENYTKYQTLKIDTATKLEVHKKEMLSENSLDEIVKELNALKIESDELQLSIGEISAILKRDELDRLKNKEKITELEKKKEKFKVWVKLNEMIGSADGNKFAKFAQGITLDQLINLANNHLSVLSNRYELQRSSDPKLLLEIEVCDSFQGNVIRPVSTLSGGESFIVSLSLALGLSELASQKIAIDSLFLDEGFGTLDEDSLETALNALNLLQSSGKMVGVISHVEALKERIPLQIKIIPKGDGTSSIEMN